MRDRFVIVTAADASFFDMAQGCIRSVRDKPEAASVPVGFLDLGCSDDQLTWLRENVDFLVEPEWQYEFAGRDQVPEYLRGLHARPFLRDYFPGFEYYFWIDADAWVQDWRAVELFLEGARKRGGMAIVPEVDRGNLHQYGQLPRYWDWNRRRYGDPFGDEIGERFRSYPTLNVGVFALERDAPHWSAWQKTLGEAVKNYHRVTDQIALNLIVYGCGLFKATELLPAWCNWTWHFGLPCWDESRGCLVEPYLPHTHIGIMHLTINKFPEVWLPTTEGKRVAVRSGYPSGLIASAADPHDRQAQVELPGIDGLAESEQFLFNEPAAVEWDYISPNLERIRLDRFFPHMEMGDKSICAYRYLRRHIPHRWYVDRRESQQGFLTRDEVHVLYNNALQFRGKPGLQIGGARSWSACHIASAGVRLDVIDPQLAIQEVRESVLHAVSGALGPEETVLLHPAHSPEKVQQLAAQNQRWSLCFVDEVQEESELLTQAKVCEKYAEADAMVVFCNLVSPAVSEGLDYFRDHGWSTMIYNTMQIIGVAWRGNVRPVAHLPDPCVEWSLPAHLANYRVGSIDRGQDTGDGGQGTRPLREHSH